MVYAPLTRDHLSVISGITATGRLLARMQDHAFNGADIVRLLHQLVQWLGWRLLVIWDGAPIHHDKHVKAFLAATRGAVLVAQLPGYAPDLNPDEGVWEQLKHVELANVVCQNQDELRQRLRRALTRLRRRSDMIRRFIEHYGY